jgi:hypothetical protein
MLDIMVSLADLHLVYTPIVVGQKADFLDTSDIPLYIDLESVQQLLVNIDGVREYTTMSGNLCQRTRTSKSGKYSVILRKPTIWGAACTDPLSTSQVWDDIQNWVIQMVGPLVSKMCQIQSSNWVVIA